MYKKILDLKNCYGCGVCAAVCPVGIIGFETDAEGFYRPVVTDGGKCTKCGFCSGSCAALSDGVPAQPEATAFSVRSADKDTLYACSSGGAAYELGRAVIEKGGVACGVRYNAVERRAEHSLATTVGELDAFRGSKYLPSYSPDGLRRLFASDAGTKIVFGLPCQIASVRKYLKMRKKEESYLLVDFFCHGTPSMLLWHKYLADHAELASAAEVGFRDKRNGWHDSWKIWGKKDAGEDSPEIYRSEKEDLFYRFFLCNYVSNAPCYGCSFRGTQSAADLRLGDMWGRKFENDRDGISAMLAFGEKGSAALRGLGNAVSIAEESVSDASAGQIKKDLPVPPFRKRILSELGSGLSLGQIYRKYRISIKIWHLKRRIMKYF